MNPAESERAPIISVIIPTYNRASYIVESVESVLQQENTDPGHEVIVIDDGSTDETRKLLVPYESRIHYVYQENTGPSAARNLGLELARGEFVAFLDSDDWLLPGALAGQLACMSGRSEVGAVQAGWRVVNQHGETLRDMEPWHQNPKLDLDTLVMATPIFLGGMLCRRSWAVRAGGFDTSLKQVEDVEFVLQLALLGCEFAWLRRPAVSYRQHPANITQDALEQILCAERVLENLFLRPELPSKIKEKKDRVFYYRNAWFAWRLYRTEQRDHVEEYLRRSLACSAQSVQATVLQWYKLFSNWSRDVGAGSADLRGLLTHVRVVAPLDQERWEGMEQMLPWWAAVWSHYLSGKRTAPPEVWAAGERLSTPELILMAQRCLLITPVEVALWVIDQFLKDARGQELSPAIRSYDALSLYLTVFGQAVLARRGSTALRALGLALRHCWHPRVLKALASFACNALRYGVSNQGRGSGTWR